LFAVLFAWSPQLFPERFWPLTCSFMNEMRTFIQAAFVPFAIALVLTGCGPARFSVGLSGPPACPYGYYEVPPYNCAPDGFYGPEWYNGGVFIGAGPWYHGPRRFYGHVDHDLDFRHGYRGALPGRGEAPRPQRVPFHGQAMHDSRGHEGPRGRR
jgi:hypothetical protein